MSKIDVKFSPDAPFPYDQEVQIALRSSLQDSSVRDLQAKLKDLLVQSFCQPSGRGTIITQAHEARKTRQADLERAKWAALHGLHHHPLQMPSPRAPIIQLLPETFAPNIAAMDEYFGRIA